MVIGAQGMMDGLFYHVSYGQCVAAEMHKLTCELRQVHYPVYYRWLSMVVPAMRDHFV